MRLGLPAAAAALAGLAACGQPANPPLVSAQSPPGTGHVNSASQPQPINSLPPGFANISPAVGATQPNYLNRTFGLP